MGQGKTKISRSLLDLQPSAVLDFFRIYPNTVTKPNTYISIHGGSDFGGAIFWQGISYQPVPIEVEGFEINGNGQLSRPKIRIANVDYLITSLLQNNEDLIYGKVVRKRTFLKYIDDINFDGGNPFGEADQSAEIAEEEYLISQKTSENKLYVELELTSPLDLDNYEVNNRVILGKYCSWLYRGEGCRYNKQPIEQEDGANFSVPVGSDQNIWSSTKVYLRGQYVYVEHNRMTVNNQKLKTYYVSTQNGNINNQPENNPSFWQKDGCNKSMTACKKRFGASTLPFGGYPGTDGFNYG
jgi:lambda family phage minor tail protein L